MSDDQVVEWALEEKDDEIDRLQTLADTRDLMLSQLRAQFDDMVRQRDAALDADERLRAQRDELLAILKDGERWWMLNSLRHRARAAIAKVEGKYNE